MANTFEIHGKWRNEFYASFRLSDQRLRLSQVSGNIRFAPRVRRTDSPTTTKGEY
jgi:hypothetical protein